MHQHLRFLPKSDKWHYFLVKPLCKWMTYFFGTDVVLRYFTTGVFEWKVPLLGSTCKFEDTRAVGAVDWWGINYYTRYAMQPWIVFEIFGAIHI